VPVHLGPHAEQHLEAHALERSEERFSNHGIVGSDCQLRAGGVQLVSESDEGEVGVLAPAVRKLGRLDVRPLDQQDGHARLCQPSGVPGAAAGVCLQRRHDRGALRAEFGDQVEDSVPRRTYSSTVASITAGSVSASPK